jgi:hypothetical protein
MAQPVLMINEGSFTDYHRLGSTARIVSGGVGAAAPTDEKQK